MTSKAVSLVLWALCEKYRLQTGEMYYHNGAEKVVENKNIKALQHFPATFPEIQGQTTDLAAVEKEKEYLHENFSM